MIEIGIILSMITIILVLCDVPVKNSIKSSFFIISIFLLFSYNIFDIKPKNIIKSEYISMKIVSNNESPDGSIEFNRPVLIRRIKIDYPYTFILDKYYYKIFVDILPSDTSTQKQYI